MTSTSLIAMTARAGRSNHRFIVPPSCRFTEIELSDMVRLAKSNSHSDSYVYASHQVQQTSGGRNGTEVLVLTNVGKTRQWSDLEKRTIQSAMEQKLGQFARLVEKTNWDELPTEAITQRSEMLQWQSEMQTLLGEINRPETENKVGHIIGLIVGSITFAACLLAGGFYAWNQYNSGTLQSSGGETQTAQPGDDHARGRNGVSEQVTASDSNQILVLPIKPKQKPDPIDIDSTLPNSFNYRITLEKFISPDNDSDERRRAIRDICKAASELAALTEKKPKPGIASYKLSPLWELIHEKVPNSYAPSEGQLAENEGKILYPLEGEVFGNGDMRSIFNSQELMPLDVLKDYVGRDREDLLAQHHDESLPLTIRKTAKLLLDIADLLIDNDQQPVPSTANVDSITP